jgi:hypothetical protein
VRVHVVPQIKAEVGRGEQGLFAVVVAEDRVIVYDLGFMLVSTVVKGRRTPGDRKIRVGLCCEVSGECLLDPPRDLASDYIDLSDQPIDTLSMSHSL